MRCKQKIIKANFLTNFKVKITDFVLCSGKVEIIDKHYDMGLQRPLSRLRCIYFLFVRFKSTFVYNNNYKYI